MTFRILFLAAVLTSIFCADAQMRVVRCDTLSVRQDALLMSRDGLNRGSSQTLRAQVWTHVGDEQIRSLVQFGLEELPADIQILEARLALFHVPDAWVDANSMSEDIAIEEIIEPWGAMNVTWKNKPKVASDYLVEFRSWIPEYAASYRNIDVTEMVRLMIQNPDSSFGFSIRTLDTLSPYRGAYFGSSKYPLASKHPKLIIKYQYIVDHSLPVFSSDEFPVCPGKSFTLTANINRPVLWYLASDTVNVFSNANPFSLTMDHDDTLYVKTTFGDKGKIPIKVTPPEDCYSPKVYELVTPNEDGENDVLWIEHVEHYTNSLLVIYNQWGTVLKEIPNYRNSYGCEDLDNGVYGYMLQAGQFKLSGTFVVKRD